MLSRLKSCFIATAYVYMFHQESGQQLAGRVQRRRVRGSARAQQRRSLLQPALPPWRAAKHLVTGQP